MFHNLWIAHCDHFIFLFFFFVSNSSRVRVKTLRFIKCAKHIFVSKDRLCGQKVVAYLFGLFRTVYYVLLIDSFGKLLGLFCSRQTCIYHLMSLQRY